MTELPGLDYCPQCDLPTFDHDEVILIDDEFHHRHCFDRTKWVVKRENLVRPFASI